MSYSMFNFEPGSYEKVKALRESIKNSQSNEVSKKSQVNAYKKILEMEETFGGTKRRLYVHAFGNKLEVFNIDLENEWLEVAGWLGNEYLSFDDIETLEIE